MLHLTTDFEGATKLKPYTEVLRRDVICQQREQTSPHSLSPSSLMRAKSEPHKSLSILEIKDSSHLIAPNSFPMTKRISKESSNLHGVVRFMKNCHSW